MNAVSFFIVIFIIVVVLIIIVELTNRGQDYSIYEYPIISVKASIFEIGKDFSSNTNRIMYQNNAEEYGEFEPPYLVYFELETGELLEYKIKMSEHSNFYLGDKGTLTYKGSRFISFTKDS